MKEKTVYTTNEWKGYGKQNYYWNEYRTEGNKVNKYHCNRHKHFDGHESEWMYTEDKVISWNKDDNNMPDWLKKYF